MNQGKNIRKAILDLIDEGVTDRTEIYDTVIELLEVPRPTVRRVAHLLRLELLTKVAILDGQDEKQSLQEMKEVA